MALVKAWLQPSWQNTFISKGHAPKCIDCDPLNQTFGSLKALNVQKLELLKDGEINPRLFDRLMETLLATEGNETFVIDNGSAGFLSLCDYMLSNHVMSLLEEEGHNVFIHCILVGGESLPDTLSGFAALASSFPTASIVLWLNEFFGALGNLEDIEAFNKYSETVFAQVRLPKPKSSTFGEDLSELRKRKLTFEQGVHHKKFDTMVRRRLNSMRCGFFEALEQSNL